VMPVDPDDAATKILQCAKLLILNYV